MKYIECKLYIEKEKIEILEGRLISIGIYDSVINDPDDIYDLLDKKNSYDWDYIDDSIMDLRDSEPFVTVYLSEGDEEKLGQIKAVSEEMNLKLEYVVVNDEDWKDNWKEYFKPAHITDKIVIKPTWEIYEQQSDDEIIIEIDPGMAFGTGTHETTSGCIKLLEKYMKSGDKVLDVGSGSGILSIVAALLGAKETLGIEIDPDAVIVGQENVALNGLSKEIKIVEGDLTKGVDFQADVVVANLMADLVKMLSKDVAKHLKEGGIYISSGILAELSESVAEVISQCGFDIEEILYDGEWCAIAARYKGNING